MTTAAMILRCRTLLDEVSEAMWTDVELYQGLADGQQEVANYFVNIYLRLKEQSPLTPLPKPLESLYTIASSTTLSGLITNPTGFWHLILATYAYDGGTSYNCRTQQLSASLLYDIANTYLVATVTNPTVYQATATQLLFLPAPSGTANYSVGYLKYPTAISAIVEPTLPEGTHNAIVFFAVAQMLFKDQRVGEAQAKMQDFMNELQLIG